jgi:hypothetical protein
MDRWGGTIAILAEVVLGRPHRVKAIVLGLHHDVQLLLQHLLLSSARWMLEKVQHAEVHHLSLASYVFSSLSMFFPPRA